MRDGASRRLHFKLRNSQVRRYCLPRKVTTRSAFASTVPINSGRELVCAKKNLKLISKRIVQSLIATPRGRRTYPEKKSNRWRITRRCAVPQAKPAVSREPGSTLLSIYIYIYGRRAEEPTTVNDYLLITREAQRCASRSVKEFRLDPKRSFLQRNCSSL